jgi:hypothetical protein
MTKFFGADDRQPIADDFMKAGTRQSTAGGEFAQEVALVHAVLEGFFAVDEDHGDFVGVEAAEFVGGVHIELGEGELSMAGELDKGFLDHLAEVASLAGIENDFRHSHGGVFRDAEDFTTDESWEAVRGAACALQSTMLRAWKS